MAIIANIIKPGIHKERKDPPLIPAFSIKNIHEIHLNAKTSAVCAGHQADQQDLHDKDVSNNLIIKPVRTHHQEQNQINIKKTSRYLEDLTNIGDN